MNRRKWFSSLAVLLAILIISALGMEVSWAQESVEPDVPNQPEALTELTNRGDNTYSFLAIGAPYEDIGSVDSAGAFHVIYGSDGDLTADGNQLWYEGHDGMSGSPEEDDHLGDTLAVGDFDGDGNLDLAIGEPDEDFNTATDAGAVRVLYGASGTLTTTTPADQTWHQNSTGIIGSSFGDYEYFGSALTVGDFDGNGYDDLAIGVPGETVAGHAGAGQVNVIYGSATGLTADGNQVWSQDSDSIYGNPEANDQFGYSLASADFDADGYDDLAVGVPYKDLGGVDNAGGVNIIYGSAAGLTNAGDIWFDQDSSEIIDTAFTNDDFGFSLAVGDFDGDHYADLAVGVPFEDWNLNSTLYTDAGAVSIIYGSAVGLTFDRDQLLHQGQVNDGETETGDSFGYSLTAGDFNGDGRDDLAVGAPYEAINAFDNAGAVSIIYGNPGGLTNGGSLTLEQDNPDMLNTSEANDYFGKALAAGNFNGDHYTDLAIGVPREDLFIAFTNYIDAGAVHVIYGSATGLTLDGDQFWTQNSTDIKGAVEDNDRFGYALAAYCYPVETHTVYLPLVLNN